MRLRSTSGDRGRSSNPTGSSKDPKEFLEETERPSLTFPFRPEYGSGVDVMERDRDDLLILDAWRLDHSAEHNRMDGDPRRIVSQRPSSSEFLPENLSGETVHEYRFTTPNPAVEELDDDGFFLVRYADVVDNGCDSLKSVSHGAVVDAVLEMYERYPNKRSVVAVVQTHAESISPTGRELAERHGSGSFHPGMDYPDDADVEITGVFDSEVVDEQGFSKAYPENVEIPPNHAEQFADGRDGNSVITSDHGGGISDPFVAETPRLRQSPLHGRATSRSPIRDTVGGEAKENRWRTEGSRGAGREAARPST